MVEGDSKLQLDESSVLEDHSSGEESSSSSPVKENGITETVDKEEEDQTADEKENNNDTEIENITDSSSMEDSSPKKPKKVKSESGTPSGRGGRDRKKVERFTTTPSSAAPRKHILEAGGSGTRLGDIPYVEHMITKLDVNLLRLLHRILYNRIGSLHEVRKNLRNFTGFANAKDDVVINKLESKINALTGVDVRQLCSIFAIQKSGMLKEDLCKSLAMYLLCPTHFDKTVISKVKKSKKSSKKVKKSKTPKKKTPLKKAPAKTSETATEDNASGDSEGQSETEPATDVEDGEEEEEDDEEEAPESPKKKKATTKTPKKKATTPAKKAPKSPAVKAPKSPAAKAPKSPAAKTPKSPAAKTPKSPAAKTPKSPAAKTPKSPAAKAPKSPAAKAPKSPPKKTPKKAAATPKSADKKRKLPEPSDEDDSDTEPLAKKIKPSEPTELEINSFLKEHVKSANLEEVTMKTIYQAVYDNYPDADLTHKKDFIKQTVKKMLA